MMSERDRDRERQRETYSFYKFCCFRESQLIYILKTIEQQ